MYSPRTLSCYKYGTASVWWFFFIVPIGKKPREDKRGGGLILTASEKPIAGVSSRPHMSLAARILPLYRTDAWYIPAMLTARSPLADVDGRRDGDRSVVCEVWRRKCEVFRM